MEMIIEIIRLTIMGTVIFLPFLALAIGMDFLEHRKKKHKARSSNDPVADGIAIGIAMFGDK